MKQNNPENKVKKKGTIKQIKATASFFSGVSAIRYFYQQIKFESLESPHDSHYCSHFFFCMGFQQERRGRKGVKDGRWKWWCWRYWW